MILYLVKNDETGAIMRNKVYKRRSDMKQSLLSTITRILCERNGVVPPNWYDYEQGQRGGLTESGRAKWVAADNAYYRQYQAVYGGIRHARMEDILPSPWRLVILDTDTL